MKKLFFIVSFFIVCGFIENNGFCFDYSPVGVNEHVEIFETAHFKIIYQVPLKEEVPKLAYECESAYGLITKIFDWKPSDKIDVFFTDRLDVLNGWATTIPHNMMGIFANPSEPGSTMLDGDYLQTVVLHELTHVITMDKRYGYNELLTKTFGKIYPGQDILSGLLMLLSSSPVMLSPEWMLEGMSMWSETAFTQRGRGRSSFSEMLFRCAVNEKNLLPYSKWYLDIPYWPYGMAAYHYGMKIVQYISETSKNDNPVGNIQDNVAKIFMFNIDSGAKVSEGKSFAKLANEMLEHERQVQTKQINIIKGIPVTTCDRLNLPDLLVTQAIFAGEKIYYHGVGKASRESLYLYDKATNSSENLNIFIPSPGRLSLSHDGRYIFYTMLNVQNGENLWYELKRYDIESGENILITNKGRYREVALSPDGLSIAAVAIRGGKPCLIEMELDDINLGAEKLLTFGDFQTVFAGIDYSPDGTKIVYIEADEETFALKLFNHLTKTSKTLYQSKNLIISPTWHPLKDTIVFSADINGVFNLYEYDIKGATITPLTNVIGGVFSPHISQDAQTILAIAYDSQGSYITMIPYDPDKYAKTKLPVIVHEWKKTKESFAKLWTQSKKEASELIPAIENAKSYNSFGNIRFDYWYPWYSGYNGGVAAFFSDPAGYQNLNFTAGKEFEYDNKIGGIHYEYAGLPPKLHVYARKEHDLYPNLLTLKSTDFRFDHAESSDILGISLEIPLVKQERTIILTSGYERLSREFTKEVSRKFIKYPLSVYPTDKDQGSIWADLIYIDSTIFPDSNSTDDGRLIRIGGELCDKSFGGDISTIRYLLSWNEYISMPWFENHVLKGGVTYGQGSGDEFAQGLFGLGGFNDPVASLQPGIPKTLELRGYQTNFQVGNKVCKVSLAYRFPLLSLSEGQEGHFPIYYRQLFTELYYEIGRTWTKETQSDFSDFEWIESFGAEVNYAIKVFRFLAFSPGVGVAYVPDRSRIDTNEKTVQFYLSVKGWISY